MTTAQGAAGASCRRAVLRCALVAMLGAALAACAPLPQPFKPAEKSAALWSGESDAGLSTWGSVAVRPPDGLPASLSSALVDGIVEGLHAREVPASARPASRSSVVLEGQVSAVSGALRWVLLAPGGETALRFEEPAPGGSWRGATARDLAAIAERTAGRIAAALAPTAAEARAAPGTTTPVVVAGVQGAPGAGGPALARAMRRSLAGAGVAVADVPNEATVQILGRVSVESGGAAAGDAAVAIAWTVLRPDGSRIGTVTQSNRVRWARLAGSWTSLAEAVASAGAPGIAELLRRAAPVATAHAATPATTLAAQPESPPAALPVSPPALSPAAPPQPVPDVPPRAPLALSMAARSVIAPPVSVATRSAAPAPVEAPIEPLVTVAARMTPAATVGAPIEPSVTVR